MLFSASIEIPLSTTQASPLRTTIVATVGVLRRVWIRWRWGIGNLGGCRILYHEFQHWPLSIGDWFPSADEGLEFEESFEITGDPAEFVVEAYNLDDSYPHTLWVAFNILRPSGEPLTPEQVERMFAPARGVLELA